MGGSPTQTLNQQVCQKYGWGIVYGTDASTGHWIVEVYTSTAATPQKFTVPIPHGDKKGKAAVSEAALEGLEDVIAREESKPVRGLRDVFPDPIPVLNSHSATTDVWQFFWMDPPDCVGIDTEGNQVSPPVLVQVSTESYTILEVPRDGRLSENLLRLLETDSITKVFCDNFSHRDKKCLGLDVADDSGGSATEPRRFTRPPIVDVEVLAMEFFGPTMVPRGLSKLMSLCMPELNVRIEKPGKWKRHRNIGKFALIEQGKKKPLGGLHDLNHKEQQYAALDSWCTLKVYQRMMEEKEKSKTPVPSE